MAGRDIPLVLPEFSLSSKLRFAVFNLLKDGAGKYSYNDYASRIKTGIIREMLNEVIAKLFGACYE